MTQELMYDALTIGGMVSNVRLRAISHIDVTAQGTSQFITLVD